MSQDGSLSLNHRLPAAFLPPRPAAHLLPPSPNCPSSSPRLVLPLLAPPLFRGASPPPKPPRWRERERPPVRAGSTANLPHACVAASPFSPLWGEESASTTAAESQPRYSPIGRDLDDRWRPGINQRGAQWDKLPWLPWNHRSSKWIFIIRIECPTISSTKNFYCISTLTRYIYVFILIDRPFISIISIIYMYLMLCLETRRTRWVFII